MRRAVAILFTAGMLFLPQSFASAGTPTIVSSRAASLVSPGSETAVDDLGKGFGPDDVLGTRRPMTLAVNGRLVATVGDPASAMTANRWNWTFLLLGCAGLVMASLARRPVRRIVISA